MQKLIDTIKLMAKTGLFFANADGNYSESEKQYITDFIKGIEMVGELDDELKTQVLDTVNHTYTFDEIIGETRSLLDGFNDDEKKEIRKSLKAFVNKVIAIDGKRKEVEQEYYLRWREAI